MKKSRIIFLLAAFGVFAACSELDELTSRVDNLETKVETLSGDLKTLNDAVKNMVSVTRVETNTDGYTIHFSDNTTASIKNGAKGDKGDKGDTGAQGEKGDKGDKGDNGDAYFSSFKIESGKVIIVLNDAASTTITLPIYTVNISSVTYIPEYQDGIIYNQYVNDTDAVAVQYLVYPNSAAEELAKAVAAGTYKLSYVFNETKTRALTGEILEISAESVKVEGNVLTVSVPADSLKANSIALCIANTISDHQILSAFTGVNSEKVTCEKAGVIYNIVKLADGKFWMAENLRYIPEGLTPSSDLNNVTAGIFNPLGFNEAGTALEFKTDEATIKANGYLYQSEVALGLSVGDLTTVEQAEALEGVQGICPDGWHIPTAADILGLVGKSVGLTTNVSAPYYNGNDGSIQMLNEDGFNIAAYGAITINDNKKTSGTMTGKLGTYTHIVSGFICGSSYAGFSSKDGVITNIQFYGLMPMTNKATVDKYTCNGSKLSYRIGAAVRCVRD